MSIKMKLVSCISAFILVLGIFIFGVLSAEQATVNLGGSISFEATDVYARVTGRVQNAQDNPTLETLEFSADNDNPDQSSWSGLQLQFDSRATNITIEVIVENLSMERELTVNLTDMIQISTDNLRKTITLEGDSYVSGTNTAPIPVATSNDSATNTSKVTFIITFDVIDHNKSLPNTNFDYDINLYDESVAPEIPTADYQSFNFEVIDGTENEVRITCINGTGDVVIPESFSFGARPLTSFTMQSSGPNSIGAIAMVSLYLGEFYYTEEGEERSKTNMFEFSNLMDSLTYQITIEPTYRYEFDGYSEINAMLLFYAIILPSQIGNIANINYYLTNDEFTRQAFTTDELMSYIMETCPEFTGENTEALEPLFATGLTILETDPLVENIICEGTDYTVREIGDRAFSFAYTVTSITIPDSVTSIGEDLFYNSVNDLTSVYFGENSQLTSIGNSAFNGCRKLTSITIPAGVTSIGNRAFDGCFALAEVYNYSSLTISELRPSYLTNYAKVIYNASDLTEGKPETRIRVEGDVQYYEDGSNLIALATAVAEESLTMVSLNDQTTEINQYAFSFCDSLTTITIPDSVTSIGGWAFYGCDGLTSVDFGESSQLKSIGRYSFGFCDSLTTITIPDSVTSIGREAFFRCISLTSITIPDSVTSIGDDAFYGCQSLSEVTIDSRRAYQNAGAGNYDCGALLANADTVYVNANLVEDTSLTASSYLTSNFTRSETAENGYYVYTRN